MTATASSTGGMGPAKRLSLPKLDSQESGIFGNLVADLPVDLFG